VQSAQVIFDQNTGRSKGFGFVEMDTDPQAQAAIQGLHKITKGVVSRWTKPSLGWPVLPASLVVALTAVVAVAVVMVMEVMVVVRIETLSKADSHDPSVSISQPFTLPFLRLGIGAG